MSLKIPAAALIIAPAAALAADTVQLTPGLWEMTTRVADATVNGNAVPLESYSRREETTSGCLSPEKARDPATYFLHISADKECEPAAGVAAGGRLAVTANCKDREGPLKMAFNGTYDATRFHVVARVEQNVRGAKLVVNMTVDGRLAGLCMGGEAGAGASRTDKD